MEKGEELEVKLASRHAHRPADAVAKLNGYAVNVAGAADRVGKTVKVRVQRVGAQSAYAVLVDVPEREPPVDPETALEAEYGEDGAKPRKRAHARGSGAERGRKPATDTPSKAVEPEEPERRPSEPEAPEPPAASESGEEQPEKPKRKRRRGSRGGRGRKKKTPAAEARGGGSPRSPSGSRRPSPEPAEDERRRRLRRPMSNAEAAQEDPPRLARRPKPPP